MSTADARLKMPPQPLAYEGREAIAAFLRQRADLHGAAEDGISAITWFAETGVFASFGLPRALANT